MKKPVIISLVALMTVVAVVVGVRRGKHEVDPIYEGKPVSQWVSLCVRKPGNFFSGKDEEEVLRISEIGSDAVPYLLKAIEQDPGFLGSRIYNACYGVLPSVISRRLPRPVNPEIVQFRAFSTLNILGRDAKGAIVPFLASRFTVDNPQLDQIREYLSAIGADAKAVVPILTNAVQHTNQTFRWLAARTLAKVEPENPALIPAMLQELNSSDPRARWGACRLLGDLGRAANSSAPALTHALEDKDKRVRDIAQSALRAVQTGSKIPDRVPAPGF